jgi:hypothetical protein
MRRGLLIALLPVGLVIPVPAHAGEVLTTQAVSQIRALMQEKAARTPAQQRIDSHLLAAYRMSRGLPVAQGIPVLPSVWKRVKLQAGNVVKVDIRAEVSPTLLAALAKVGATIESAFPEYDAIRARIPLGAVENVASLAGVRFVEPAQEAMTNAGSVTSQGDAAHKAPQVRALGLTGAGVKIGVMSDGVDSLATSISTGDVPAGTTVLPGQAGDGNEGTAMLEIVHDVAPSAQLYYATAANGVASFAANIRALRDAGCTVLVDDVSYFNEGAFQDGPIAAAVNDVTATGVLYFSSAANSGNLSSGTSGTWEGDFVDSGATISGAPVHSFGGGEISDLLTDDSGPISLKWSDPLGLSGNDYDLYVFDGTLSTLIDLSTDSQTGTQDPFEIVGPQAAGSRVVVVLYSGVARALHVDTSRGTLAIGTMGSTHGHNAGISTISVAATDGRAPGAGNPFVGGGANPVTFYSSDGPRRIFYYPNGAPITPGNVLFTTNGGRVLSKPDITAADCVSTTVPGFSPFCGTSAAAPHAGAIAALLLSATPAPDPDWVRNKMIMTGLDIMAAGLDRDAGYGIFMADRSASGPTALKRLGGTSDLNGDGKSDIVWRKAGPALDSGAGFLWLMNGTTVIGATYLDPIGADWQVQAVADFTGDGKRDILWRNTDPSKPDAGNLYLWVMNGGTVVAGTGYTNAQADLSWQIQGVGDLNGDGKADIVWRKTGPAADTGAGFLWLMNGTTVIGATYLSPIGTDWNVQAVADLSGDGKADILWRNTNPSVPDAGNLYLWVMNGATVSAGTGYTNSQADLSWQVQGVGDLDGNGKADIVWRKTGAAADTGAGFLWLMNGSSVVGATYLSPIGTDWQVEAIADFTGDSKADILWRFRNPGLQDSGKLYLWVMNGATVVAGTGYTNAQADLSWEVKAPH